MLYILIDMFQPNNAVSNRLLGSLVSTKND